MEVEQGTDSCTNETEAHGDGDHSLQRHGLVTLKKTSCSKTSCRVFFHQIRKTQLWPNALFFKGEKNHWSSQRINFGKKTRYYYCRKIRTTFYQNVAETRPTHLNRDHIESNLSVPGIQGHQENALYKSLETSPHLH